ncbi:hypothetical protein C162_21828 [Paenibacillus sp. FSL R7-269]|uniref:hypothetical protein n=1 Tax=Paenibacillus sp. FSL R7-269 TaxID=1226755 RepID=UPI0003E28B6C|nr:hypothetical protein [Paenibacillus sp. FSL R7-269]ETT45220.1 hypothetical protein C162_21828 [Paenibacillus sp. FSL R7-269]
MANFKIKEVTTKSGDKYTLQFPGVRAVTKINDRMKNKHGVPSEEKMADEMFAHVVVAPKVTQESFESYREMMEVANKAYLFINGVDEEEVISDVEDIEKEG